jgi:hypothetical protein
MSAKRFR